MLGRKSRFGKPAPPARGCPATPKSSARFRIPRSRDDATMPDAGEIQRQPCWQISAPESNSAASRPERFAVDAGAKKGPQPRASSIRYRRSAQAVLL
ncbi:hypothetical protein RPC_1659 [Rhodopseudomonas palustris BisB18]|uniref:Uncharacterized protein n=1 Tax=Rhodopseudomonas palustris (strain BisB18) TaxID=316056 RepID=Q218G5_RHOPB